MKPRSALSLVAASVGVFSISPRAFAQPDHLDIQLFNDGTGSIKTGLIDLTLADSQNPCPVLDDDFRVYPVRLDDGSIPHFENFPGFNACAGTFDQGTFVGFNIVDALRKWDGASFDQIPEDETMFISSGGGSPILRETPPDSGGFVEGFDLSLIGSAGSMHTHVQYFLVSDDPSGPAPGVYMLTLEVTSTQDGVAPSDPVFIIFADGAPDQELQDAAEFMRDRLDCPGDLAGAPDGGPDGVLDASDFFAYLGLFADTDPAADLTGAPDGGPDGLIDASDFFRYLELFAQGCP